MKHSEITIQLERVRCFAEAQSVPIRPLTLLVGENSSGKSTFLAMAAAVFREGFPGRPGFNDPPFQLGAFDTIATYKGGRFGRADRFKIGYAVKGPNKRDQTLNAVYCKDEGNPVLSRLEATNELGKLLLQATGEGIHGTWQAVGGASISTSSFDHIPINSLGAFRDAISHGRLSSMMMVKFLELEPADYERMLQFSARTVSPFDSVIPLAPVRTRPRRTYDDLAEEYTPEGNHIPRMLARVLQGEDGAEIEAQLTEFGIDANLFRKIGIRRLGKDSEDPFQVQVNVGGPPTNLVDTGYGISQSLPVLVQGAISKQNSLLLVQQPEVHLHPRGQAALGTFFARLVALGRSTLLVETHSDYLVDRVRLEVRKGTLKPEDVQILYFDRPKTDTTVYPISLDAMGNVLDAPEGYRDFFLDEQLRVLGAEVV